MTDVAKGKPEKWDILWDSLTFLNKGKFTVSKKKQKKKKLYIFVIS